MRRTMLALLMLLAGPWPADAQACTCLMVRRDDAVLVGRNYDWDFSDGLVLVNPRGLEKAVSSDPSREAGSWTAHWGSVTFNQYGCGFPSGGINEKGLVVEVLWLNGSVFPPDDDRMALSSLHWIQYQLDTAASVAEVIASLEAVRVSGGGEVHFYTADRSGQAAAIEFLEGKAVIHRTGESMPAPVLTNHTYQASLEYLQTRAGWGGQEPIESTGRSLPRFARAATGARALSEGGQPVAPEGVFRILTDVSQPEHTQWSIVYDPVRLQVQFRTRTSRQIRFIDLASLDFSCRAPARMMDVDVRAKGDLARRWSDYRYQANRDLIGRSYAKTEFLRGVRAGRLDTLAAYPERARCTE